MFRSRTLLPVTLALVAIGLAGCSSSSSPTTTSSTGTSTPAATIMAIAAPSPAGTLGTKPTITFPPGPPPTQLESADLIKGTGAAAKTGDTVSVQYVGDSYSAKAQFDASWDRGQPYSFTIGQGVIAGWSEGVVGMLVGGRRELIIPPSLGYRDQAPGPGIASNDTLIFIIDLTAIG
jgi:peptidylprolyl isomerase